MDLKKIASSLIEIHKLQNAQSALEDVKHDLILLQCDHQDLKNKYESIGRQSRYFKNKCKTLERETKTLR
jgi:hypothetical protein